MLSWTDIVGGAIVLAILGALWYWLVVITEGVYFGRRLVLWLYDLLAYKYDRVKAYEMLDERILVVDPLLEELLARPAALQAERPLILDIATGTGRVPQFVLQDGRFLNTFKGHIIALDGAPRMLGYARHNLADLPAVSLLQALATPLPFSDNTFTAATCLESLEFFPSTEAALQEMIRVVKPGGFLMLTRRTGWEARAFVGRSYSPEAFEQLLLELGLHTPVTYPWQNNYDLVVAQLPAS